MKPHPTNTFKCKENMKDVSGNGCHPEMTQITIAIGRRVKRREVHALFQAEEIFCVLCVDEGLVSVLLYSWYSRYYIDNVLFRTILNPC